MPYRDSIPRQYIIDYSIERCLAQIMGPYAIARFHLLIIAKHDGAEAISWRGDEIAASWQIGARNDIRDVDCA